MSSEKNIAMVPVTGDLDVRSAPQLRTTIDNLLAHGCIRIILNFAGVCFVDSAGLALIFSEVRRMRSRGGLLSLTNVRPRVMRSLRLSRLVDYAPVSEYGRRSEVRELSPNARPLWRHTVAVMPQDMSQARSRIEQLLHQMPLGQDAVFDLTLATGEAIGNAVDHTSGEGVLATVTAYPDRAIVEVTDCGEGYALGPDEEPVSCTGCPERGRGIKLMRLLTDSVSIGVRPSGRGTVVRLVKMV